jgi:3'-5' exonuclease
MAGTSEVQSGTITMQRFAPDWHCDLMEQLSDYRACASMSLDDVALALGRPGKIGGHGSEVEAMVRRGEIDDVRAYCEGCRTFGGRS